MLEERHDIGEHERAPGPVELDARHAADGRLEPDLEVAAGIQGLEHGDVGDGNVGVDLELVSGRERAHPVPVRLDAGLLAPRLDESVVQVVDPRAHQRRQLGLQRRRVDRRRAVGCAHDDVQARHHRLGQQYGEVDFAPVERAS